MNFIKFKEKVDAQFTLMSKGELFRTSVTKDKLWETYLSSFPEGSNPIFRERTEHDCNCCKQFIRAVGNVVSIIDNKLVSIWDITIDTEEEKPYQVVADSLAKLVKSAPIDNVFKHTERTAGTDKNYEDNDDGVITWDHFFVNIPSQFVMRGVDIGNKLSDFRSTRDVLYRGLTEINDESVDTVLELIAQNSLYRGEEHKNSLKIFKKLKTEFNKLSVEERDNFVWSIISTLSPAIAKIRNTSIGTLLVNLSEGKELEYAVKAFETIVAPTNYKRPTALVTKAMVEKAKKTIEELGLTSALERRYAQLSDINVNNILFADRNAKKQMKDSITSVFDEIADSSINPKSFNKIEEVAIDKFISDVLPTAKTVEVLFENKHQKNLVSLIAPVDSNAKPLFKWSNNFSWSYNGDLTDSVIKERVKQAGGSIEGDVCCRLAWYNYDDLDLHMIEPNGCKIYFGNKDSSNGGQLDVDMNASGRNTRKPVENIFYRDKSRMREGVYTLFVHNYCKRETNDVGFEVEVDIKGELHRFEYQKAVKSKEKIKVMELEYSKKNGFKIIKSLESTTVSKNIWGISTNQFHKVNVMMMSPNFWDGQLGIGNKHYFFMLDGCANEGQARGFFNEFLKPELDPHRKVIEIVGSKMKTQESENQLSGIGLSSTQRNKITVRVTGTVTRIITVII